MLHFLTAHQGRGHIGGGKLRRKHDDYIENKEIDEFLLLFNKKDYCVCICSSSPR